MQPDYYELLGVTRQASQEEIRSAYRRVAVEAHPDRGGTNGLFRLVRHAYETLIDPATRAAYDRRTQVNDSRQSEANEGTTRRHSEPDPRSASTDRQRGAVRIRCPICAREHVVHGPGTDWRCYCGRLLRVPRTASAEQQQPEEQVQSDPGAPPPPPSPHPPPPPPIPTDHDSYKGALGLSNRELRKGVNTGLYVCALALFWLVADVLRWSWAGPGAVFGAVAGAFGLTLVLTGGGLLLRRGATLWPDKSQTGEPKGTRSKQVRTGRLSTCPCGCGRQISGTAAKGGAVVAERALAARRDAEYALGVYESNPAAARLMEDAGITHQRLRDLVSSAIQIRAEGLQHAHRKARPGVTPDLNHLRRALESLESLSTATRVFVDALR